MNWFSKKRSAWPLLAIGLLLAGLWGTIFFKNILHGKSEVTEIQEKPLYGDVLPNFLAPVVRQEVHQEAVAEDNRIRVKLEAPSVRHLLRILVNE